MAETKWNIKDGKDFADRLSFGYKDVETRLKYRNQVAEMWDEAHSELAEAIGELVKAAEELEFQIISLEAFNGSVTPKVWEATKNLTDALTAVQHG